LGCRYGRKVNSQYLEITNDTIVWDVVIGVIGSLADFRISHSLTETLTKLFLYIITLRTQCFTLAWNV